MACCRCNRKGKCCFCVCAKSGRRCTTCLPAQLKKCQNQSDGNPDLNTQPNDQDDGPRREDECISQAPLTSRPHTYEENIPLPMPENMESDDYLPPYVPMQDLNFKWGELSGEEVDCEISRIYEEVVHWRRNLFKIPSGRQGKAFVQEMASLFQSYADASARERIALKAAMVIPALILQKPFRSSKSKDHINCIERRLSLWKQGDFKALLEEGRVIQGRLLPNRREEHSHISRRFANLMGQGKVKEAARLISDGGCSKVLPLNNQVDENRTVYDVLLEKHPSGGELQSDVVSKPTGRKVHPVIFQEITGQSITEAALHTEGSAGPSGLDAYAWKRMCSSFQKASTDLCDSVAMTARRIAATFVDPEPLAPLTASRLVALDKSPGVRPVGVGEVRRIISKSILNVIRSEVRAIVGSYQLCAGQKSGNEAAVHALNEIYDEDSTDAVLLVDTSNAFNRLNRKAALANINNLCPALGTVLTNTYRSQPKLFIEGECILSREGITQGDPLAMVMYAVATLPLIKTLQREAEVEQIWFADDSAAGGDINQLRRWWNVIVQRGPAFGYYVNSAKTSLIVKEDHLEDARKCFEDTEIQITTNGKEYLGSPLGAPSFKETYVQLKVEKWKDELQSLVEIAETQPQAAYSVFTLSMQNKWSYLARTTKSISHMLQQMEDVIRHDMIPTVTGRQAINDVEKKMFALPTRLGGLGVVILSEVADKMYRSSVKVTEPLKKSIRTKEKADEVEIDGEMNRLAKEVKNNNKELHQLNTEEVYKEVNANVRKALSLAKQKGSSLWLNTIPVEENGFVLHKGAFQDAIALRYGWRPSGMPSLCACGNENGVEHALGCSKGGIVIRRHNEIRDVTASLLQKVTQNVETEPSLQPLTGEVLRGRCANTENGARVDVKCTGFWNAHQDAFLDVRVFNPLASCNRSKEIKTVYKQHEKEKRRVYDQRIREIERGTFTPLVFSATGGMGPSALIFFQKLAAMIATERGLAYQKVIFWIRQRITFSLLRSAISAIRATRFRPPPPPDPTMISIITRW